MKNYHGPDFDLGLETEKSDYSDVLPSYYGLSSNNPKRNTSMHNGKEYISDSKEEVSLDGVYEKELSVFFNSRGGKFEINTYKDWLIECLLNNNYLTNYSTNELFPENA